ncbi:MAG: hypothetical protein KDD36_09970 [Flavobacteriales bacterium]|nr:hypothetical protein [Flavobacteriales bacterium]
MKHPLLLKCFSGISYKHPMSVFAAFMMMSVSTYAQDNDARTGDVQNALSAQKANWASNIRAEGNRMTVDAAAAQTAQFPALQKNFTKCNVYELDGSIIQSFVRSKGDVSELTLNLGDEYNWTLHLQKNDIRGANYVLREQTANGVIEHPRSPAITYWGHVNNNAGDIFVSISTTIRSPVWCRSMGRIIFWSPLIASMRMHHPICSLYIKEQI